MYFLLSQLSFIDLLYSSAFVPKIAIDFLSGRNHISFISCGIQFFLFMLLMGAECLLLAVMAYDRYVAVCHPLHYSILMCPTVSASMVAGTWSCALLNGLIHVTYTMNLHYCPSRQIHHFFCEISALLRLVCTDTSLYENSLFISGIIFLLLPILAIMASYGKILFTVVGLRSNVGKRKALATCSSHIIVVSLFYGTAISKYFLPKAYHTAEQDKVNSIFYTILTPMLNPLIYSLRNKEVAGALRKVLGREILIRRLTSQQLWNCLADGHVHKETSQPACPGLRPPTSTEASGSSLFIPTRFPVQSARLCSSTGLTRLCYTDRNHKLAFNKLNCQGGLPHTLVAHDGHLPGLGLRHLSGLNLGPTTSTVVVAPDAVIGSLPTRGRVACRAEAVVWML
ncbi:olfactory receptor 2AG2-like [Perognathus longimembris pacificus]|uniref:olfactory receptor 2AG2-like n=1 Tax=Perognathus longimembris pacificus TaxID=214514 RepID=UPI0020197E1B|nr:olfactory receptor 2AG2-like [Perognathus longimembris pacificus]